MRWWFHAILALSGATSALPAQSASSGSAFAVDSIVLERTGCLGTCPAYRLSVRADGFVRFVSHNRGDDGRTESAARGRDIMRRIAQELERARFADLPPITMGRFPYCRIVATDSPTIVVSTFTSRATRSVSYYTGCVGEFVRDTLPRPFIRRLSALADSIDAIAARTGWIRPAPRP